MTKDNRIDSIAIPFYAALLVIYGMFNIFSYLAQEGYVSLPYVANWIQVFFAYTGITLFYKNPDNPEIIYMLTKSLSRDGFERYEKIAELLDIVLKLDPGHTGAKKLLKEIEPELGRE